MPAPVEVDWLTPPIVKLQGQSAGYSLANKELHDAVVRAGILVRKDAAITVDVTSPPAYSPDPHRRSILISMWESPDFPSQVRGRIGEADLVIVPSQFCVPIFAPYVKRVEVVPLGVHPHIFTTCRRVWNPGDSFQWLLVGAANARKGYDVLEETWHRYFWDRPDCHLYLKTTGSQDMVERFRKRGWEETGHEGVLCAPNMILDMRKLPVEALVETYHRSHAFVFPTAGEGTGLTLVEAMSTGLPCIATKYSGLLDYTTEDTIRYVDWVPHGNSQMIDPDGNTVAVMNSAYVEPHMLAEAMQSIMADYRAALKMGRRAAHHIRERFTWDAAGHALAATISRFAAEG